MRAIAERHGSQTKLLDLKDDKSELLEAWEKMYNSMKEWAENLTRGSGYQVNWEGTFKVFLYTVAAILLVLLAVGVVSLVRRLAKRGPKWDIVRPPAAPPADPRKLVSSLLSEGQLKAALRAQWKLYLSQCGIAESRTPAEVLRGPEKTGNVSLLNVSMFGPQEPSLDSYRSAVTVLEPPGGAP